MKYEKTEKLAIALVSSVLLVLSSCASMPDSGKSKSPRSSRHESADGAGTAPEAVARPHLPVLSLTFAGDIMAHNVNYSMGGYSAYRRIYQDIQHIVSADDLTFGNLEMPVTDSLPMSTYPRFNVHSPYVKAAADSGFDVFSLANNHSNDQGKAGVAGTLSALSALGGDIRYSGLRSEPGASLEPVVIDVKGWKVLFLSVTEILNSYDVAGKLVYYVAPTEAARLAFLGQISAMRREHQCDLFVLSIHLNEPEYVRTVSEGKKNWFARLAASGVDVVWGHHPHVMQGWELIEAPDQRTALCMYSMGNFVSGQRVKPAHDAPASPREYTGDAVLLRVSASKPTPGSSPSFTLEPVPVTNFTDPAGGVVVRVFDTRFISGLPERWRKYYSERFRLMNDYLPLLPDPAGTAILEE